MYREKIQEIVNRNNHVGSTTWIIRAAVETPDCIIVSKDSLSAKELERQYFEMIKKSPWYRKLRWILFGRNHPKFLTVNSRFEGLRLPIIFDNSALQ